MRQQGGETRLALDQWPRADVLAVEVEKIEQQEHEASSVAGVRSQLDHAERRDAVGGDAAQLAIEIGPARAEGGHGLCDRGIFIRPIEPGGGKQLHSKAVETRMHAVAVELDFVEPLIALRRRVDERGELRPDPSR